MKNILLLLCTALTLASCSEISTDPAPTRITRTQTVSMTYSLTAPGMPTDTVLQNPRIAVYLVTPEAQSDGSVFYPLTSTNPLATLTPTLTAQTFAFPSTIVVKDGEPAPIVRLVFTSDNLPGRRATFSSTGVPTTTTQRITTNLLVNSSSRATTTYTGFDFARRTAVRPPVAPFRKQTDLAIALY